MAKERTQAEEVYWFAKQLLTNAENLQIPEELRKQPGAYRLIYLYTLAYFLKGEFYKETIEASPWASGVGSKTSRRIQARWHLSCYVADLMLRAICNLLEGVCTGAFYADYIKGKVLGGLQALGLCKDVQTYLTDEEQHLKQLDQHLQQL